MRNGWVRRSVPLGPRAKALLAQMSELTGGPKTKRLRNFVKGATGQ